MTRVAAIETDGLTKYYGDVRGIEDLTFAVESGEIFGYLGPNGAGKTTTIRTLLGFLKPSAGAAYVLGADVREETALVDARRNIGYLPADPGFVESVTGQDILDYHRRLKGDTRSHELADLFDPPLEREVGEYSRGNRQKLAVVQAFMHDPDLVVMDEPTSGLDPLVQERFYEFLADEQARGTTVFLSSHILSEVRRVCDRIGIIRDGRFVTIETVEELLTRSGTRVEVVVAESVDPADFDLPGVHDLSVDGTITFTFTGSANALVDHLASYTIRDLRIGEAPLEEVFMRFYGTTQNGEGVPRSGDIDDPTEPGGTNT